MIKLLIKHLIYEQSLNVFFETIQKNLFSNLYLKAHYSKMSFSMDGYLFQFHQVNIKKITSKYITLEFDSAIIIPMDIENADAEVWDKDESPFTTNLDYLIDML